jgi:predicted CopG family antitoxin
MATKTISIMEDAYRVLLRHKRPQESFSDVIRREFSKKGKITDGAGIWLDMTDEDQAKMEALIHKVRSSAHKELMEKIK